MFAKILFSPLPPSLSQHTAATIGCINVERIDIAFLIDSSKSVNKGDFSRQKEFIREILREFPIGQDKSLVGVIKYGAGAKIEIRFSDYVRRAF